MLIAWFKFLNCHLMYLLLFMIFEHYLGMSHTEVIRFYSWVCTTGGAWGFIWDDRNQTLVGHIKANYLVLCTITLAPL